MVNLPSWAHQYNNNGFITVINKLTGSSIINTGERVEFPLLINDAGATSHVIDLSHNNDLPEGLRIETRQNKFLIVGSVMPRYLDPTTGNLVDQQSGKQYFVLRIHYGTQSIDATFEIDINVSLEYPSWNNTNKQTLPNAANAQTYQTSLSQYLLHGDRVTYHGIGLPKGFSVTPLTGEFEGRSDVLQSQTTFNFFVTLSNPLVQDNYKRSNARYTATSTVFHGTEINRPPQNPSNPLAIRPSRLYLPAANIAQLHENEFVAVDLTTSNPTVTTNRLYYVGEKHTDHIILSTVPNNAAPVIFSSLDGTTGNTFTLTKYVDVLTKPFELVVDTASTSAPVWISPFDLGSYTEQSSFSVFLSAQPSVPTDVLVYSVDTQSTIPTGLSLNETTGELSGILPSISYNYTYHFDLVVSRKNFTDNVKRSFSLTVTPKHSTQYVWQNVNDDLGSYDEHTVSVMKIALNVQQNNGTTTPVTSGIVYTVAKGVLPVGLELEPRTGEIIGTFPSVAANTTVEIEVGIEQEIPDPISNKVNRVKLTSLNRTFHFTIKNVYNHTTANVYAEHLINPDAKRTITDIITNNVPNNILYRPDDHNFGIPSSFRYMLETGLVINPKSIVSGTPFLSKTDTLSQTHQFSVNGRVMNAAPFTMENVITQINNTMSNEVTARYATKLIHNKNTGHYDYGYILTIEGLLNKGVKVAGLQQLGINDMAEYLPKSETSALAFLELHGEFKDQNPATPSPERYRDIKWSELQDFDVLLDKPVVRTGIVNGKHEYDVIVFPVLDKFKRHFANETDSEYNANKYDAVGNLEYITEERLKHGITPLYQAKSSTTGKFVETDWTVIQYNYGMVYSVYNPSKTYVPGDMVVLGPETYPRYNRPEHPSNITNVKRILQQHFGFEPNHDTSKHLLPWMDKGYELALPVVYTKPNTANTVFFQITQAFNTVQEFANAVATLKMIRFDRYDGKPWEPIAVRPSKIVSTKKFAEPDLDQLVQSDGTVSYVDELPFDRTKLKTVKLAAGMTVKDVVDEFNSIVSPIVASLELNNSLQIGPIYDANDVGSGNFLIRTSSGITVTISAHQKLAMVIEDFNREYHSTKVLPSIITKRLPANARSVSNTSLEVTTNTISIPLHGYTTGDIVQIDAVTPVVGLDNKEYQIIAVTDSKISLAEKGTSNPVPFYRASQLLTPPIEGNIIKDADRILINGTLVGPTGLGTSTLSRFAHAVNALPGIHAELFPAEGRIRIYRTDGTPLTFAEPNANQHYTTSHGVHINSFMALIGATTSQLSKPTPVTFEPGLGSKSFNISASARNLSFLRLQAVDRGAGVVVTYTGPEYTIPPTHTFKLENINSDPIYFYDEPPLNDMLTQLGLGSAESTHSTSNLLLLPTHK